MIVKELINELQKCNQDDIVIFDLQNTFKNNSIPDLLSDKSCGVANVLIGTGTLKGLVFLSEEDNETD